MTPTTEQIMQRLTLSLKRLGIDAYGFTVAFNEDGYVLLHPNRFQPQAFAALGNHPVEAYHNVIQYANLYLHPRTVADYDFVLTRQRKAQAKREAERKPGELFVSDWVIVDDKDRGYIREWKASRLPLVEIETMHWDRASSAHGKGAVSPEHLRLIPPLRVLNPGIAWLFANPFEIEAGLVPAKPE